MTPQSIPGVSAIIPNWNGASRLPGLFATLHQQTEIHELILVDNGSTDLSREIAARSGARVVSLPANLGFAAAVNRGIEEARCPWLAIINNDVQLEPDWLRRLLETAIARDAWFATGKLLDMRQRDRIDGTYDTLSRGATAWRCGAGSLDGPEFGGERVIQFAPFTALLARRELFARAGLLDVDFKSYLEDVEFGLRCATMGLSGVYVPSAVGYHAGSATLGRWHPETVRLIARNQLLLIAKHYPEWWFLRLGWPVLVGQILWGLLALRHGRALAWMRGKGEGIRLLLRSRKRNSIDITNILRASEDQIRVLQKRLGHDWYWRCYFALT